MGQYLVYALDNYGKNWFSMKKKIQKQFNRDIILFKAFWIVNDLTKVFEIKTLDGGILNNESKLLKVLISEVKGMINDNQKHWDEKLSDEKKYKFKNNAHVFIATQLYVYFTEEYELTKTLKH